MSGDMTPILERSPLLVFEYSGTARSGKGSIVNYIAERYTGVATEETGADYRVVTHTLLNEGLLTPDMTPDVLAQRIGQYSIAELSDIVAARPQIVEEHGLDSFYASEVGDIQLFFYFQWLQSVKRSKRALRGE